MQRKGACALYQERSDVERRRARAIACERKREASYFLVFLRTDQSEFRFQFFFSFFFFCTSLFTFLHLLLLPFARLHSALFSLCIQPLYIFDISRDSRTHNQKQRVPRCYRKGRDSLNISSYRQKRTTASSSSSSSSSSSPSFYRRRLSPKTLCGDTVLRR